MGDRETIIGELVAVGIATAVMLLCNPSDPPPWWIVILPACFWLFVWTAELVGWWLVRHMEDP